MYIAYECLNIYSINLCNFLYREDFLIPWYHDSQDSDEYAFHLLSCMAKEWMKRSDLSRGEWTKEKSPTIIYQRLLWSKLYIRAKQPSCKKVCPSKAWVNTVVKVRVAAKK